MSGTIGDYAALVVPSNSSIKSMGDLVSAYKADPSGVAIGGGSVPGGMDHLVAAMVMQAAGADPTEVKYVAYDAGGKAMAALLSGEIKALSTGFSEAVAMAKAGEANIIGVTSNDRVGAFPDAKTMKEQGIDTYFVNWRGFFAAPGLPQDKLDAYQKAIEDVQDPRMGRGPRTQWLGEHPQSGCRLHDLPRRSGKGKWRSDEEAGLPLGSARQIAPSPPGWVVHFSKFSEEPMALDRWIALIVALVFLIYGHTAFFGMDDLLPPILKRNPIWPSTFPKILSVVGVIAAITVLLNIEKSAKQVGDDMDISKWRQYRLFDAVALIGGMVVYALTLRSLGFLAATFLFLSLGGLLLGERRYWLLVPVAAIASYGIWYLVDSVLGIYMTPYPAFLGR